MPGKYPRNGVPENLRTHIGRKFSAAEKGNGYRMGICGTGKQQMPRRYPRRFTDAYRPEIFCSGEREMGIGWAFAELE